MSLLRTFASECTRLSNNQFKNDRKNIGLKKKHEIVKPRECSRDEFKCDNGACINIDFYCDGQPDCLDDSDERGCSGREITLTFFLSQKNLI